MEALLLLSERISSIKYEKAKQNVNKQSKIPFSGLWVLLTGLWDLNIFLFLAKIVLKITGGRKLGDMST